MIMVTSEEAVKLAVVAAASILFVALLLLTNYDRQCWCRQTKPSLIWYSMCEVPSPTLGTSLIEYQLSLLIWYSMWEVPSPTLGTSHIEYRLSQQLCLPTSEIKANHCNHKHDGFQPTSRPLVSKCLSAAVAGCAFISSS